MWPQMNHLLGYETEFRPERVIFAVNDHHLAQYQRMAAACRELGYRVDDLEPAQVRALAPLAGDSVVGGIHLRFGGQANPQRTVQAYAWALQDLGGRILQHTPVFAIETKRGGVSAVLTPRGRFACDELVIAAGPQTGMLLEPLGVRLPLASARVEMIVTEPVPLMRIGGVDGNGLYGRQTLRGNLAFGGGPHEWMEVGPQGPERRPTSPLIRSLARRVAELFQRGEHLRVIRSWAGVVETTPDGRPVIDRLAEPANLTVATMSGVGFGLSPASGHAVRDLVLDGRCGFANLANLSIARFANVSDDWREARGWRPTDHETARAALDHGTAATAY
jgi:sarcosine oxidase subunit beta